MKKIIFVGLFIAGNALAQRLPLAVPVHSPDVAVSLEIRSLETKQVKETDGTYSWELVDGVMLVTSNGVPFFSEQIDDVLRNVKATRADLNTIAINAGFTNGWLSVPNLYVPNLALKTLVEKYAEILGQPDAWVEMVIAELSGGK